MQTKLSTYLLLASLTLLQACASTTSVGRATYDFGLAPAVLAPSASTPNLKLAISLADISTPVVLEGNTMFYRLAYDNVQQLRPYAAQQWSMPPAQLLNTRIKSHIVATGGTVVSVADGVSDLPILKIELEEFSQVFSNASNNQAQLSFRASLVKRNKLIAQRNFNVSKAASSADAAGGARAMQLLTDETITNMLLWLQSATNN